MFFLIVILDCIDKIANAYQKKHIQLLLFKVTFPTDFTAIIDHFLFLPLNLYLIEPSC